MARQGIGLRVARWRDTSGMTQQQLADAAGVTKQYISLIENGKRAVTKRSLLEDLARGLGVSTTDLTGQPYPPLTRSDFDTYVVIPQIRAALDEPDYPPQLRPLGMLEEMTDRAMAARMACDVPALGEHLPALLANTRHMWFDHGNRAAGELLVKAAVTGSLALKAAGWVDLGIRLAELADNVATQLGDPVCIAAARFTVAQCALSTGSRRRSATLAAAGADELDRLARTNLPGRMNEDVMAWMGMLRLHAALSVAGMPNGDPAGHLAEAAAAARHVTGDPWRMEFSAANVDTWAVGIALENGHHEQAPELARRVDVSQLRTKQRRSRLHLDTARGHYLAGDTEAAIRSFLAADHAAPGDLRSRPTAVEIVAQMVRDAPNRGGSEALRDLAVRVGVDPLAPPEAVS